MKDSAGEKKTFAFRLSKEKMREFRGLSAKDKLDWLEEANRFVEDFVPEEKRRKWKRLIDSRGPQGKDPFDAVIGIAKSGIKDGSLGHDDSLCGKKK